MAMVAAAVLFSCKGRDRVIPVKVFSKIYAEMFITDQWLKEQKVLRKTADTAMVYEPIFQRYGYTVDDYRRSVDYYTREPETFSKVFEGARVMLQAKLDSLTVDKKAADRADSLRKVYEGWKLPVPRLLDDFVYEGNYAMDTVGFELDTLGGHMQVTPVWMPVDSLLVQVGL